MTNPNTIRDGHESEATPRGMMVPADMNVELTNLLQKFNGLQGLILHDKPVKESDLRNVTDEMHELRFVIVGQSLTLDELRSNPELEHSVKIWEAIEVGQYIDVPELRYLNDRVARILAKLPWAELTLDSLVSITDSQAAILATSTAPGICLNSLTSLTDAQALSLSTFAGGGDMRLAGLQTLSDSQAAALAQFKGTRIFLYGLSSLTDDQAAAFAASQLKHLFFGNITAISRKALQILHGMGERIHADADLLNLIHAAGPLPQS